MLKDKGSFRDPAGFVYRDEEGNLRRAVNFAYRSHYDHLIASGLYERLISEKLLVSHRELSNETGVSFYKVIAPEEISCVSYPYEWTFSQFKDAALLTLDALLLALEHGMVLKDASSYNVLFTESGAPVFIDTLSFEVYEDGSPWVAYHQFCQHFLAPLALMSYRSPNVSSILLGNLDGVPLPLATKLLPKSSYLSFGLLLHIHLHAKANGNTKSKSDSKKQHKNGQQAILNLAQSLKSTISNLTWVPDKTIWADYYSNNNYLEASMQHKVQLVEDMLKTTRSSIIWDVGANSGRFSELAARYAERVIATDNDPAAAEQLYLLVKQKNYQNILPIVVDIVNPAPSIGWNNQERLSLLQRVKPDTIMALALIHHLNLSHNIPFSYIAELFASKCSYLIIEFVPKADSQVQRILAGKKDIYGDYNQIFFEEVFFQFFTCVAKEQIKESSRTLYLLKRK